MVVNLLDFDLQGLIAFCESLGEKRFRALQLFRWIHHRGVSDFAQMSDLARSFRARLSATSAVVAPAVVSRRDSSDGSIKWMFDAGEGCAVEAVYIPEVDRATLCLSTQAGCAVGCRFCSTGYQGFSHNLRLAQIIGQLWYVEHTLRRERGVAGIAAPSDDRGRVISNVVMMGMGEPLQNYDALLPALKIMLSEHAYGLSRRRVTVSTCGVVPMIERLAQDCAVALAISLHAADDALRDRLVPINRKYPLDELLPVCKRYLLAAPRDFLTIEYCMLAGINDSAGQAHALVERLRGLSCKVNLIPFNPFAASGFERSSWQAIRQFAQVLGEAGIVTTIRKTRGEDIDAACGQLAGEVCDRTKVRQRRAAWEAKESYMTQMHV